MNALFNMTAPHQHQTVKVCPGYGNDNKRELSLQAESLYSIAMYDMDSLGQQQRQHLEQQQDMEPLPVDMETAFGYLNENKRELSFQTESLFSMAMYIMDSFDQQQHQKLEQQQDLEPLPTNTELTFYPVDEYKDDPLRECLELSDDYLFGEEEENNMSNSSMLNPILHIPCGQNVALHAAALATSPAYTGPGVSMHIENQMQQTMDPNRPNPEEALDDKYKTFLNNMSKSTILNPTPLNLSCGQNVASRDARNYTEPVVSVHMENQMQPTMDHIEPTVDWLVPMMKTSCQYPTKKRHREEPLHDESGEELNHDGRFRPYQAGQWEERFSDLCLYRVEHGNCLVPLKYREDRPLARWIKRQRYQYKRMKEGKSSTMTEERVKALEEIGFVWDSHGAARSERLEELKKFRSIYKHCNVPANFRENPHLAIWVKCQRTQYRLLMEGKVSNMTPERIHDLEAVGFEWKLRYYKKQRTM
jgi:hypothetical protein